MVQRSWRIAVAIAAALGASEFTGDALRLVPLPSALARVPYLHSGLSYLADIALMVLLLRVAGGVALARQWVVSGLGQPMRPALVMGLCLFAPLVLAGLWRGRWRLRCGAGAGWTGPGALRAPVDEPPCSYNVPVFESAGGMR